MIIHNSCLMNLKMGLNGTCLVTLHQRPSSILRGTTCDLTTETTYEFITPSSCPNDNFMALLLT